VSGRAETLTSAAQADEHTSMTSIKIIDNVLFIVVLLLLAIMFVS
jgi:hypothetical protein